MSNGVPETAAEVGDGPAIPFYFQSGRHGLFGWLHRAREVPPRRLGLVLCMPFGYEAVCAHRSMRALAQTSAALGIPALRFDYAGTGDSEDFEPGADQIALWTSDVIAAVEALKRQTGVERVCLLGVRLGALLASVAAARCSSVSALIAVAPVVSGRRYLREARTMELAAEGFKPGISSEGPRAAGRRGADGMQVGGYGLSAATVAALSGTDLLSSTQPPIAEVMIIDRDDLPGARKWADALAAIGVRTEYRQLPGFVQMAMTRAEYAVVPQAMLAAVREWLSHLEQDLPPEKGRITPRRAAEPGLMSRLTLGGQPSVATVAERAVGFGDHASLFGIVAEPPAGEVRRRAVILLNAGVDQHVGPCRLYVYLARSWVRRGYFVLRMDLAGTGDSETRPGRRDDEVYPPEAVQDVRAAVSFMLERYRVREVTLAGLCSGAYHSLRAAVAQVPVNRILMVNPLAFFWKDGKAIDDLQLAEVVANPRIYRKRAVSWAAWRRLLSGKVNAWRIVRIHLQRPLFAAEAILRDWARRLHVPLPHDLGYDLECIAARGVQIVFAFARGEAGIDLLRLQGGASVKRLGDRCRVHIIDGADHIFSRSEHRAMLENVLSEELLACPASMVTHPDHSARTATRYEIRTPRAE